MRNSTRRETRSSFATVEVSGNADALVERLFYTDCDPEQAMDRSARVQKVADLINASMGFGSDRAHGLIKEAFQSELTYSNNLSEAVGRMNKLLALINLKLKNGLKLGPENLGVSERLYLVNPDAPTQSLDLNLSFFEYGKRLQKKTASSTSLDMCG